MILQFIGENRWLSNYEECIAEYEGLKFSSSEAAYMAAKTEDTELRKKFQGIIPSEARKLGLKIKLRPNWDLLKNDVMTKVLESKFTLNTTLKVKLLNTGNKFLMEGNWWHDNYWGVCTCEKCKDKEKNNNLGLILMDVRNKLRKGWI